MSEIITTLHPENDEDTNLYPNIKSENIPDGCINQNKLSDDVNNMLANAIASVSQPKFVTTLPTTDNGLVVYTDGYIYRWDSSLTPPAYVSTGVVYQATQISDADKDKIITFANDKQLLFLNKNYYSSGLAQYDTLYIPQGTDIIIEVDTRNQNDGSVVLSLYNENDVKLTEVTNLSTDVNKDNLFIINNLSEKAVKVGSVTNATNANYNIKIYVNYAYYNKLNNETLIVGDLSVDGEIANSNNRARTEYIRVNGETIFELTSSTNDFVIYAYDINKTFTSQIITAWSKSAKINLNGYVRLKFRDTTYTTDITPALDTIINNFRIIRNYEYDYITLFERQNNINNEEIIRNKIAVSDVAKKCASAPENVYIDESGWCYFTYLSSNNYYGERRDIVMLSMFSVANPNVSKHFEVAKHTETIDGYVIDGPYEPNIIKIGNKLYISFYNSGYYLTRPFNIETETFETIIPLMIKYNNNELSFNDTNVFQYVTDMGGTFTSYTIFTTKFVYHNNLWYGAITSPSGNAILCSSSDGIVWDLLGLLPSICEFEVAIAFSNDIFYCVGRTDTIIYQSADLSTFTQYRTIKSFTQRPQLFNYKNKLFEILPNNTNTPDYVGADHRNIIDFIYDKNLKLELFSRYGIVYPSVFLVGNDIYILFSSGTIFYTINNQSKDVIYVAKIGEIFEDKEFKFLN